MQQSATRLPPEADSVVISVNPMAGRRSAARRVERLERALLERGHRVEVLTNLAEAASRANRLSDERRLRAFVGVGGDGTAAELVNRTTPGVPVTVLPAGTANLFSRCMRLGRNAEKLAQMISLGRVARIDAGRAGGRVFLMMIGCGFDAEVVRRVQEARLQNRSGGHISYASYLKPVLGSIRSYGYPEIRVEVDGGGESSAEEPCSLAVRWAFVFNMPRYGWGVRLAPAAVPTDGLLDLCAFPRGSLWNGLRYVAAAQCGGGHRWLKDCMLQRVRRLRISSREPVGYQLDGDPGGLLPVDVEVLPKRMTAIVPESMADRLTAGWAAAEDLSE